MIDPSQYDQIRKVATLVGVPPQTLDSAVTEGHVESAKLASGVRIVSVVSAKAWAADRPKRGPRPKSP